MSHDNDLVKMWERQKAFASQVDPHVFSEDATIKDKELHSIITTYHIIRELTELVDETNWKSHIKYKKQINKSNIIEEYIDVLKFYINLGLIWNISAEDVVAEFDRKSSVVEQKWQQENMLASLNDTDKIVAIDIDGVLSEYPFSFVKWLIEHNHIKAGYDTPDSVPAIIESLGGFAQYTELKHQYRMSGAKRNAVVTPGASAFLKLLRNLGYKIVLLSARPYKKYVRIFADTIEWLNKNHLVYDAILFDSDKEDVIIKRFPQVKLFIDDDINNIKKVTTAGFNAVWISNDDAVLNGNHINKKTLCYSSLTHLYTAIVSKKKN